MIEAISAYCRKTGQQPPDGPAAVTRSILESLALCFRLRLGQIAALLGKRFRTIHVVGGGSKNPLLCQFTANATGLPVLAGPAEATVTGNALVQAIALGWLNPAGVREVVRASFPLAEYEPRDEAYWQDRFGDYLRLTGR
jgi:sugar (pentulose or hexulose) kinase